MKKVFLSAADFLGNKAGLTGEDLEVVAYGLEVAFSNLLGLSLALCGGIFLGNSTEVLPAALVWLLIRRSAGGAHCKTLWRCVLVSTVSLLTVGKGALWLAAALDRQLLLPAVALCSAFTLTVMLNRAPAESPRRPFLAAARRQYLRRRAILTAAILSLLLLGGGFLTANAYGSLLLAAVLGMVTAGIAVTPAGYRLLATVDFFLDFSGNKIWPGKGGEKE